MMNYKGISGSFKVLFFVSLILVYPLLSPTTGKAQQLGKIQKSKTPLILASQGSFFVGGETVEETRAQLGSFVPEGHISINQMYVRYMVPKGGENNMPIVMVHGMALTGKCWETTPDGRMGWDEYFVRKGYPVYVPDQVGRGRSGFNQAVFNDVRTGAVTPDKLPPMWRFSNENTWPNFHFGTKPGSPYPGLQFPEEAMDELAKQGVPDISMGLSSPSPNYKGLLDLATQIRKSVLISHSQSGSFPLEVALIDSLYAAEIKALVLIEPGSSPDGYTDAQIKTLSRLPILIVFGDNLDTETGVPGHSWQRSFEGYKKFVSRIENAGGKATMMHLPQMGIAGNSHMIMHDKNNLQVADLILKWTKGNIKMDKSTMSSRK